MEELLQLLPLLGPETFYKGLAIFLLWYFGRKYIKDSEGKHEKHSEIIDRLDKCLIALTLMTQVHEVRLDNIEKTTQRHDEEIKDSYLIKYTKK